MTETEICIWPQCDRKVEHDELCFLHKVYSEKDEPPKPKKRIAYYSKKRQSKQVKYRKIVEEMISEDDRCEILGPTCTGKAQGLDHTQKRSPSNLLNKKNLKRACNACQDFKERFPEWAKENNHSISRFSKAV